MAVTLVGLTIFVCFVFHKNKNRRLIYSFFSHIQFGTLAAIERESCPPGFIFLSSLYVDH